ncbi:hypothetical protein GGF32_003057 [Allomyces javanicus]|nr:hypothetical protein GGF32_003057 [Allomyces javanicus]
MTTATTLTAAKHQFLDLLHALGDRERCQDLLAFAADVAEYITNLYGHADEDDDDDDDTSDDETDFVLPTLDDMENRAAAREELAMIAADLRESVPVVTAVLESEAVTYPAERDGVQANMDQMSDLTSKNTVHVDAFLYDDATVDDLCDEGQLARYYCTACGMAKHVEPLNFISHSLSVDNAEGLFSRYFKSTTLPILDIGSRTGALLYAAAHFTTSPAITGIELNRDWADLAQTMVKRYALANRVSVLAGDVRTFPTAVKAATGILVMNNVFEYFADTKEQRAIWTWLLQHWRAAWIVTVPALESQWRACQLDSVEPQLVREFQRRYVLARTHMAVDGEFEVSMYRQREDAGQE